MMQGKKTYEEISIPTELEGRVQQAIASVDRKKAEEKAKRYRMHRKMYGVVKGFSTVAASLFALLLIGVNSSQVLAEGLGGLPIMGGLVKVLTVRSYQGTDEAENITYDIAVPELALAREAEPDQKEEGVADTTDGVENQFLTESFSAAMEGINGQIAQVVDAYLEKCRTDMAEYKEAFFQTGGTEAEWAGRMMDVRVSYDVKYQDATKLSMVLSTAEAWVSANSENLYYNLDLVTGEAITLKDLLGEDWIEIANQEIIAQIEAQVNDPTELNMYWGYGDTPDEFEGQFTTVTEATYFYINENGNVVICFPKYEIAPGYMGVREFEIP